MKEVENTEVVNNIFTSTSSRTEDNGFISSSVTITAGTIKKANDSENSLEIEVESFGNNGEGYGTEYSSLFLSKEQALKLAEFIRKQFS